MRLALLFIFTILLSLPAKGQVQEKYFHDLKGFVDIDGTTHLFYRYYYDTGLSSEWPNCGVNWRDDTYHYNTSTEKDTVYFPSFYQQTPCDEWEIIYRNTSDFIFVNNDINNRLDISSWRGYYTRTHAEISSYNGSFFDVGGEQISKGKNDTLDFVMINIGEGISVSVALKNDSLPSVRYPYIEFAKQKSSKEECTEIKGFCFYGASDSVIYRDFPFVAIDRHDSSQVYYQRNDSLFISDYRADSLVFLNADHKWSTVRSFEFSEEDETIISVLDSSNYNTGPHPYKLIRSWDKGITWAPPTNGSMNPYDFEYPFTDSTDIFAHFLSKEGESFTTAGDSALYIWHPLGKVLSQIQKFDSEVTGLFVTGNDIDQNLMIYILTENELFVWSNEGLESLKKIPTSTAPEPTELPNQVVLHQNYPNPFNPSTLIRYQLPVSSVVSLKVFDMLGREVAVLVDGKVNAGSHEVTFNADGLSSGVYFYQLQTNEFVDTKQFTLIK